MLRVKTIEAAIFQSILKWINRLLTLLTSIFLARILNPEDFGLLAIAMATMGIMEGFSSLGLNAGLIQNDNISIEDYDVAWTYGYLLRGIILFFFIFFCSDFIARFYNNFQLSLILKVLSVQQIFYAFSNIWLVEQYRNVNYRKDFIISAFSQFSRILTVIPLAIYFKNIWALVAGLLVKSFVGLILQYSIIKKRPKINFNLKRFKKLFMFSIPIIGVQIVTIIKGSIDKILLGKLLGVSQLGYYQIASRFGFELPSEIKAVVSQVMFPAFSRMKNSQEKLKKGFLNVLSITLVVSLPFCIFLYVNTDNIVLTLLGSKWSNAISAMRILVVAGFFQIIHSIINPLFKGYGKPKYEFFVSLIQSLLAIGLVIILTNRYGIIGTAYSMVFALSIPLLVSCYLTKNIVNITFYDLISTVKYPALIGIIILLSSDLSIIFFPNSPWKMLILNMLCTFLIMTITGFYIYKKSKMESLILFIDGIKKIKKLKK